MDIADIKIPEEAILEDGTELKLNGAGVLKKFFMKIYIGALYLPQQLSDAEQILETAQHNRVALHILYKELSRENIATALHKSFKKNLSVTEFDDLTDELSLFLDSLPHRIIKGDTVSIDYQPGSGTTISINGKLRGVVAGRFFNRALLATWLGENSVSPTLKAALLHVHKQYSE